MHSFLIKYFFEKNAFCYEKSVYFTNKERASPSIITLPLLTLRLNPPTTEINLKRKM